MHAHLFKDFIKIKLEQMNLSNQAGEHDGHCRTQLNQNVQRRAGGVLERIANGITNDGSFMAVRTFTIMVARFDILFRVIPCT